MQSRFCNVGYAARLSTNAPREALFDNEWLCNLGHAIYSVRPSLCNLGYAIYAMLMVMRMMNLCWAIMAQHSRSAPARLEHTPIPHPIYHQVSSPLLCWTRTLTTVRAAAELSSTYMLRKGTLHGRACDACLHWHYYASINEAHLITLEPSSYSRLCNPCYAIQPVQSMACYLV